MLNRFPFYQRFFAADVPPAPKGATEDRQSDGEPRHERKGPTAIEVAIATQLRRIKDATPQATPAPAGGAYAMDSAGDEASFIKTGAGGWGVNDACFGYLIAQGFTGWQVSAMLMQHWLIAKACRMPAEDAIRNGWSVASVAGDDLPKEAVRALKLLDAKTNIATQAQEFLEMGRGFGIRIAIYRMRQGEADPTYYEKPFDENSIQPGDYLGLSQVDPQWCAPILTGVAASRPESPHFYEPTWWTISGKRYHRTHLCIYRHMTLPDFLKPAYLYGAPSVPQLVYQRVYQAEISADEGPKLLQTKRTIVWKTSRYKELLTNIGNSLRAFSAWATMRDNHQIKIASNDDDLQQVDTSLSDVPALAMMPYQIVAAAAEIPFTKLINTSPSGLNATGDYERAVYDESLVTIQNRHVKPLLSGHYLRGLRSHLSGLVAPDALLVPVFNPVSVPSPTELSTIRLNAANEAAAYLDAAVVSQDEARRRLATDAASGWHELGLDESGAPEVQEPPQTQGDGVDRGGY